MTKVNKTKKFIKNNYKIFLWINERGHFEIIKKDLIFKIL